MTTKITLGVVDQSPMRKGGTATQAIQDTIELAQVCERAGYSRYWVAEHHNSPSFSGTSPELLIAAIASKTDTIRVGSGGVMLPHYSALKVAEQFCVLESLHPGRIELGVGRAPGSDQLTAAALAYPKQQSDSRRFPQQVSDLLGFLSGEMEDGHPFANIKAQPGRIDQETRPDVWLLGSSEYSGRLAALMGLPFTFADFFGGLAHGPEVAEAYRSEFRPSKYLEHPQFNVTVQVLCAPTEEEATFLGSSRNINKASTVMGKQFQGLLPPDEAVDYPLSNKARQYIDSLREGYIDGNPEQVRDGIIAVANKYGTTDISIVTNAYSYEVRARSYELVSNAFGLKTRPSEIGGNRGDSHRIWQEPTHREGI